ncbi:MAG: efflux RND transporter permease subunit, partial [Pseudomonadales bacterium]
MNTLLTNPRVFVLLIALIIVSGLTALNALPRDEDPRIANRYAFVMTTFPGASAERVEALVTEPLENRLREISDIKHIDSRSSAGFSSLTIELVEQVGINQTKAVWAEVRDKLEQARSLLPRGVANPILEERRSYPFTLIVALTWAFDAAEPDLLVLGRYAQELQSRLRSLPGMDYIAIHGGPEEEIVVDVDPARAALLGLSPHAIGSAVLQADAKVTAGEIHNSRLRMAVEVEGALDTLERIRQIPLRQSVDGSAVQVGDVADVKRQAKTPARDLAIVDGQPAVVVGIRMLTDQRSDLWSAKVRVALASMQQQLPANIKLKTIFDQEHYTSNRLQQLTSNIVLGFLLIAAVLLFTLGWRAALIVAAALPLTALFAFACMNFTHLPIHQMSVTGLIVALGIMVDNAIVMVDTVHRYKREGLSGQEATLRAVKHLWLPLLGSTLTTILAFMPIVLMPGAGGEFVGGIGLTVLFSLLGSYLVSHLVVAGLAGRFLVRDEGAGWFYSGMSMPRSSAHIRQSIAWALANPKKVLAMVAFFPVLGFGLGTTLPEQFYPPTDRNMFNLEVFLPTASSIDKTKALTERISAEIETVDGLKSLHWFIGRSAPSFYYNLIQGKDNSQYYAQAMLTTEHFSDVDRMIPMLQQRFDELFPEAQIILRRLAQGPAYNAPVELRLVGFDLGLLKKFGDQLRLRVMAIDDVVHVRTNLSEAVPKVWLSVNENMARAGRLSLTDIAGQLHEGIDGVITGSVLEGTQSLPVRVRARGQKQVDIGGVHSWLLVPGDTHTAAQPIPYVSLGDVSIRPALGSIPRRDGERINTVQIYIRDGVLPATVLDRVKQSLMEQGLQLPPGYRLEIAGEDAKRDESVDGLVGSMGMILVLLVVA